MVSATVNKWTQAQDFVDTEDEQFIYNVTRCYIQRCKGKGGSRESGEGEGNTPHSCSTTHATRKTLALMNTLQG